MKETTKALAAALTVAAISSGAAADESAPVRGYIRGTGTQYINTGYTVSADTMLEMNFDGWQKESLRCVFGYGRYNTDAYLLLQQGNNLVFWHSNSSMAEARDDSRYFVHRGNCKTSALTACPSA